MNKIPQKLNQVFNKFNTGPWLVFLAALLWASDAPFRVGLSAELPTTFIVLGEHLISLLVLAYFIPQTIKKIKALKTFKEWVSLLVIGVGGSAVALLLFTEAFSYMNPSVVILLQKIQPLIAIGLAYIFLKETLSKTAWFWVVVALSAAYLLNFPGFIPQLYIGEEFNPNVIGALLALGAAGLWAAATVAGKSLLKTFDFKTLTTARFLVATVFLLLLNLVNGNYQSVTNLDPTSIFSLIVISITSGAVALFIYYRGLQTTKASVATVAELGFPVAAVFVNYIFLGAVLSPVQVGATALLLLAIYRLSLQKS